MDELLMQFDAESFRAELLQRLGSRTTTRSRMAAEIGVSRTTLTSILDSGGTNFQADTVRKITKYINQKSVLARPETVFDYLASKVGMTEEDHTYLQKDLPGTYLVFKPYASKQSILVTKLTVSWGADFSTFTDSVRIRSPHSHLGEDEGGRETTDAEFEHSGLVLTRRNSIFFLSAEPSNLRLISIEKRTLRSHKTSVGYALGTSDVYMPFSTKVFVMRCGTAEQARLWGHYGYRHPIVAAAVRVLEAG